MTHYYNQDYTGTYSSWTNSTSTTICDYRTGTTTASGDYNNWNLFPTMDTGSIPFGHTYTVPYYKHIQMSIPIHIPSEQELLEQRIEEAKTAEITKKAKEKADNAAKKARELLLEYLDNENRRRLIDKKPLEIPSRLFGDVIYQIPTQYGRIKALKENKVITELCLSVKEVEPLPTDDVVLTKLLHVMHDEENMLKTANHSNRQENLLARLS